MRELFDPHERVFEANGKDLDAIKGSKESYARLVSVFGGVNNLPSSVLRAKRENASADEDAPSDARGYDNTAPQIGKSRDGKLPKHLRDAYYISGRGCGAGALSRFPQNVGRTVLLFYSKAGQTVFDPFCLTPDTWVLTSSGMCQIGEVTEGMRVLTHKGRYRPVLRTMRREVDEKIVRLQVSGSPVLRITKNHPVLAIRSAKCGYANRIALPSCATCARQNAHQPVPAGARNYRGGDRRAKRRKCQQPWRNYTPEWINAGDLRPGDYMLFPTSGEMNDASELSLCDYALRPADVDKKIQLTEECLWMMGVYVAEGHVSGMSSVNWTVGRHELHVAEGVSAAARRLFGANTRYKLRDDGTVYDIHACSATVARFMFDTFGHRAPNKKLPQWLMELPPGKQAHFLKGYVLGDGCVVTAESKAGEGVAVITTSPNLAGQTKTLLARQGIASAVKSRPPNSAPNNRWGIYSKHDSWRVSVTGSGVPRLSKILNADLGKVKHYSNYSFRHGDYVAHRILSVEDEHYKGDVCNFSVEEDESYVTLAGAVHNCGHNSRMDLCVRNGRHYVACDISAEFMKFNRKRAVKLRKLYARARIELHECDAREPPVADGTGDFTITSPPYWDIEYYGDEAGQLGKADTYGGFMDGIERVLAANFRVLKPGAFAVWFVNDFRRKGKMYFYHADLIAAGENVGFTAHDILISDLGRSIRDCFPNQAIEQRILPKRHEYGIVFRRD